MLESALGLLRTMTPALTPFEMYAWAVILLVGTGIGWQMIKEARR